MGGKLTREKKTLCFSTLTLKPEHPVRSACFKSTLSSLNPLFPKNFNRKINKIKFSKAVKQLSKLLSIRSFLTNHSKLFLENPLRK